MNITYEHPLNERIRNFLRAEQLFELASHRLNNPQNIWDTRDFVATIIELHSLLERTDLKNELLKELERQINSLQRIANTPTIDFSTLDKFLKNLEDCADMLRNASAKQGFFPKESDLLSALRQRFSIPGGTCSFDIPAFHYWLHMPLKNKQTMLQNWLELLKPLERALTLALDLTRKSSTPLREVAPCSTFQKPLNSQMSCQLVRINLRDDLGVFPEISANKHRVNIRFLQANFAYGKPALANQDIPFELTCCVI